MVIAVAAAVCSALILGASSVAQQRSTKHVRRRRILSPRIMLDLVRQPLWLAGIAGSVAGFALQIVALRFGGLALVEPILACDLIFAVLISSFLQRSRDLVIFVGVGTCTAGVAGFLMIGHPSGGQPNYGVHVMLLLVGGLAAVMAGCLIVARRNRRLRSLALALACGANYGTAAFLVKLVILESHGGLPLLLSNWPLYVLAVVGPLGFLLNQAAFREGTMIAPVLAIITTIDPVLSIALAALWLGQRLSSGSVQIAGETASLALMSAGIAVLARHSPAVPDRPGHRAGQHLNVRLTAEDGYSAEEGYSAERSHSIALAPGEPVAITNDGHHRMAGPEESRAA